jgi:hypothetical protein
MHRAISVDACVTIREACPVDYIISGQHIEFSYGSLQDGFHFSFEPAALRRLMALGAEALADLAALAHRVQAADAISSGDQVKSRERSA